jgi:FAD/FMN-containing dehydrogenase
MKSKRILTTRRIFLLVFVVLLVLIARPVGVLMYTYFTDNKPKKIDQAGYTNDASNLNKTNIDSVVKVSANTEEAALQISNLIRMASQQGKKISIAGSQHSMGGHTIYPNGIVLDMKGFHQMQLDSIHNILTVGSGARWSEIIPYLDKYKKSVAVMQSNNSFTLGGSISVNCHGWQPNSPPIASTVESFRLIKADGEIVNCSRTENTELFSLALGGYGLIGVILDVKLRVVDNQMYKLDQEIIKSEDYIKAFNRRTTGKENVGMVYGRININPAQFMEEAILSVFTVEGAIDLEPLHQAGYAGIRRTVFRASANSDYGKNLRWKAEKLASSQVSGKKFSRNQLLNESVEVFQNGDTNYTDILHEYFIPKDSVIQFIHALKKILPAFRVDLLNITVRNVKKDEDSYLKYANDEVFGFVMLFNQPRTAEAEKEMKALNQRITDAAISLKGTYYLPYRLHATRHQMHKAYPQARSFFELKKKYDPNEVFQNQFYVEYK